MKSLLRSLTVGRTINVCSVNSQKLVVIKSGSKLFSLLFLFGMMLLSGAAVFAQTDIQITSVTVNDASVDEGQAITYTVTIKNNGPQATTVLQISDVLPASVTFVTANPDQGTYNSGTGIWDVGALNSGQSKKIELDVTINPGTSGSTIINSASYLSSTPADNNSANNTGSVSVVVSQPDIEVTKTVNDATPDVGQQILYTIAAKNIGTGAASATGLVITDVLPAGLTYVVGSSTIPAGTTYNAGTGAWTIGTLLDNVTKTLILAATVNTGQTGVTMVNTATVTAIDQPDAPANSTSSVPLTVNFPDILITKTVSNAPYNENVPLTYTVTVKNLAGGPTATNVVVKDLIPTSLTYISSTTTQGTYNNVDGLWTVGSLASNVSKVLTITAKPNIGTSGLAINNTAALNSMDQNDAITANNSASVEIEVATVDLLIEKSVNDATPDVGQTIEFTVKLTNDGPGKATSIVVKDVLPAGLNFVAFTATPAGTVASQSMGTITWTDTAMLFNVNQSLKFTATVAAGFGAQVITNTAYVDDFAQVDTNSANNTSSVIINVNGADLEVTKTVDNPSPSSGSTVIFKIKLTNNGPLAGNDVQISDLLPAGLTYVSHTVTESSYVPGTGVWGGTNLDMAIGESDSLIITATVTAANGTLVTNTASITTQSAQDGILANNTSSAFIVVGDADVSLSKSVNGSVFNQGAPVIYTLVLTNNGPFQAAGFLVQDALPAGVTYTSSSATLGSYNNVTGLWTFGGSTLANGATATLTINATVNTGTAGFTITNTGTAISVQGGNNTANDVATATFKVAGADIGVTKTASASTPTEGDPLIYTITVTNNGPDGTTGLVIKDLLPVNLSFVSASASTGSYNNINGEWSIGNLSNGGVATLTINTTIASGGGITNKAYVQSSSAADDVTANNTASVFVSALKSFTAGACIIDMGIVPQTYNNGMKPYGLVYELVTNWKIPVYWAINPGKSYVSASAKVDQPDFTVSGKTYYSGAFIIPAEYVSTVQSVINSWVSLYPGLTVDCNRPAFIAPIHDVITSFPLAVLDEQNGSKAIDAFYDPAGVPASSYRDDGTPSNLSECDDIYVMPHADPQDWVDLEKNTLNDFILDGGWLFLACHSVSALESLVDLDGDNVGDLNYLSNAGLIPWGDHDGGTLPPAYHYALGPGQYAAGAASDPFMQFLGNFDGAIENGSEQINIPYAAGWRSTTTVAVYDHDHPEAPGPISSGSAAAFAYGRAFGDPDNGMIMEFTSHTFHGGSVPENVAAGRVYGNFLIQAGIELKPEIIVNAAPQDVNASETVTFTINANGKTPPITYQWTSSCGGTFSNPNSASTDFTAPAVTDTTYCIIRLEVIDACGRGNFEAFPLRVDPPNAVPVAVNDVNTTNEDTPVSGTAQSNDTLSIDGGNVWTLIGMDGGAANGTVTMNPDGSYTYTPDANYNGTDVFNYQVCDVDGDCSAATVTITINPIDDLPVAVNDVNSTNEDTPVSGSAATNDTPSGDGGNTWTLVGPDGGASNGTVTMNPDGSYTYTPDPNFNGTDVFTYEVCDVDNDCSTATVSVTVNPVDEAPVAVNDANSTNEDTPVSGSAATNDTPSPDGGNVWTLVGIDGGAANGTVTMNPDGSYTYTPDPNFNGIDMFGYEVCDVDGDCSTATVTVTVIPVDEAPVAVNDVNSTNQDTPVSGGVSGNDTPSGDGGNVWTLVGIDGGAVNGTVTMNPDGSYTYTPDAGYVGTDVFSYEVCDADGDCSTATVSITIDNVDEQPIAVNDVNTTNEDTPVSGTAQSNDTPSGDGGNVWTLIGMDGGAANGTVTMNPDGSYTYTPDANYNGTDVFNYEVCDVDGDCSSAMVTITINPVDDVPVAVNDVNTTNQDTPVSGGVSGNDTPSGDGGNVWTLVGIDGGAVNGTVTMNPDGTYTYTPDAGYVGTDVFSYEVCDADGDCSTATVSITIDNVDEQPIAVNDVNTTNEDTPVSGTAQSNDTPSGDGGNVWALVGIDGGAVNGTVTMNPDGSYTYTPDANFNGTDVFNYQVCDVDGDCSTATVTVTVDPVDDAPVAVNDVNTTNEDTPVSGSAAGNDTPSGDGGNVWTLVGPDGGASNGTVTMNPDGSYTYTPDPNFNGTDVFTYEVCDVDGDCSSATVSVTVNPVDEAPVAVNDANSTNQDTPVSGSAAGNDTPSPDGGNVWALVGIDGGAVNGTVTMNPDGSYTYTPDAGYVGTDVFNYQVCDVDGDCSAATVTITIDNVDEQPVAVNDVNTTNEDTPVSGTAQSNDTPSGDGGNVWALVGIDGGAANGTVTMNPDGSYTYTPDANFNGTDVFNYQVCDVDGDCSTATVTVTVDPVDDAPVAVNDVNTTNEDTPVSGSAAGNDTPSGDGGNVWTLVGPDGGASNGTVTMNPDGSYTYTPDPNFNGTDVFTYEVCDVDGDCSSATVSVTVNPVDEAPVAVNDANSTNQDTPVSGSAAGNDTPSPDGGNVWALVGIDGGAVNGTVTMNPDGSYTYTPDAGYVGTDVFNYQVCDVDGDCSAATVTITIDNVDEQPVAVNDVNTTNEDTPVSGTAQSNDTPSGDGGNVWALVGIDGGAVNGTVTMNPDGSYTYTPDANFNGTDVFNYQVCDVDGDCSTATVTVTVDPVDDAPVAVNDVNTTNEDTPVSGSAAGNDTPSGDGGNVWTLVGPDGGASNGTVTMNPDGSYTYTPDPNFNGTDVFTYEVCDVDGDCSSATVSVTVNPVDEAPVAVNDANSTNQDTPVSGSAAGNDTPSPDGGNVWALVGIDGGAVNGTVTMNPDGSYTYTPDAGYVGTDVFNYQVCDVDGDCSAATVTITIDNVDEQPVAVNDVNTTNEDTPVSGTAQSNDTPSGDGGNVWALVGIDGGAANGTVTMNPDGSYTYTPDANFNGTDVFNYQVCDVDGDCSTATVTVTVDPVDDAPVAVNDVNTTNEDTPVSGSAAGNDTPSGDGGNVWTLVGPDGGASNGTVTMNPDGSYTYTPDPNFNGTDVFTYEVCDVDGDCSSATVSVTVNPVDEAPVAVNDANSTNQDTPVSGSAAGNDTPSPDGGNVWALVGIDGGAVNGTVTMNPDGSYTYTPDAGYVGTDVFNYQVCDVDGDCSAATVTITIDNVDEQPVAVNDVNTTNEDTPVSGTAQSNDTPSGDGGNVWTLVGIDGGAANGTVTMNPDGSYTYTPDPNFNGTDVFTYEVCDVDGDCSSATVTVTVDPVDEAPVAVNDVNSTNQDTPVSGAAQSNDTPSGDGGNVWTLVGIDGGAVNGTVTMNPDGSYTYTPDAGYVGTDVFNYQVCDVDGDCSTATVTITIDNVDEQPVAVNDVNTTSEDTPVSGTAQSNDTPSGDGGNVWTLVGIDGGAANGTVTMNPDGSYTYTPDPNFNGTDVFTYEVCDVDGDCSSATVTVTVDPVDEAPVAVNDVNSTNQDTPVSGAAQSNDTPSGDGGNVWTLVGIDGGAVNGTVTMNPDGSYTYTPDAGYVGTDVFNYQVCDVDGDCSTAMVTITIDNVDEQPVAVNDVNTTNEDTPVSGTAQSNDTPSGDGGNVWTLVGIDGGAANGTVTMNPDGSYTYTPDPNFNGTDVFTYEVCDVDGDCSSATVTVTVDPVDEAPVAVNDVNSTNQDTPVSGAAQSNDTPSGDGGNVWTLVGIDGGAVNGTVTMNPDGSYTYTPDAGYVGTDVFNYQVCDVDGDCSTATVTITIDNVDEQPVAVNDVNTTNEDTPVSGSAAGNDTPSGDGGNMWTLVGPDGGASNGTVTMNPDGSYTYTPDPNFNGTDVFTYEVCDVDGDCSSATVTVTVDPVDEAPVAVNDVNSTNQDTPVSGAAQSNDTPSGDGGNVWTLVGIDGGAVNGTVTMNPDGSYTYTPDAGYVGTDVFNYQVCDVDGDCSTAMVTITIDNVDEQPVAVNDVNTTNEDTPVSGTAQSNDTPSGDGGNVWTLVGIDGGAANGTVTMNPDGSYTYTPDPNFNGTDVFTYEVCDVDGDCSSATVTVTVDPVDEAPVAVNDVNSTNQDTPVSGAAQSNDTPSGDGGNVWALVGIDGGAVNGTVTMNPDGSYTYTPDAGYVGTDVFNYQVCDVDGDCSTAMVTITIDNVDEQPVAVNDVNTTNEDTPVSGTAQSNDTPSGDGGNVWTLVGIDGGAANGTVTMNPDGSYTYTPDPNFNGTDVFTYEVCDVDGDCSSATVTVTVDPVDEAPVAVNDVNSTNQDTPVSGAAQSNDTPSGDGGNVWALVGIDGGAVNGTVTMNPDGSYTYTPDAGYVGTDVFNYQVCDVDGDCSTAMVTITIDNVDEQPVAVNDVNTTNEDTPVSGTAQSNDTPSGDGGNVWTLVGIDGGAANGTVTMNPDGSYTYTPDPNFNGTDVFTYEVCDVDGDCSSATVTVTVDPVDEAPVAVNDVNSTNQDTPVSGAAQSNDTPSGDGGNVWALVGIDGGAVNGTVTMNPDGSYTYTPDAGYVGTDVFNYQVCDVDGDCSTATVTITIDNVDEQPIAVNDTNTTYQDTPVSGTAQSNDTPSGDGGNTWALVGVDGGAANGTVTMNPDGSYTYTPDAGYIGTDVFTYEVCDVDGDCSQATVTITMVPFDCTVDAGPDLDKCHNEPTMLSAISSDPNATFSWAPASELDNPNIANPTTNVWETTTFTVTATSADGCVATDEVTVTAYKVVKAKISVKPNNQYCEAPCVKLSTRNNPDYSYEWRLNGVAIVGAANSNTYCACEPGIYSVHVTNTVNGCMHTSKPFEVIITPKLQDGDLVSAKSEMTFSAWPNPTADQLYITLSNTAEGAVKVQLMDMFGRQMMVADLGGSKEEQTIKFNMNELSAGMYIVRVLNGDNRMEQKVMLIK